MEENQSKVSVPWLKMDIICLKKIITESLHRVFCNLDAPNTAMYIYIQSTVIHAKIYTSAKMHIFLLTICTGMFICILVLSFYMLWNSKVPWMNKSKLPNTSSKQSDLNKGLDQATWNFIYSYHMKLITSIFAQRISNLY